MGWCETHVMQRWLIQPGRPMQNSYVARFNGKFRNECFNEHWFETLPQAREVIRAWVQDFNQVRPHSSIGCTPQRRCARFFETPDPLTPVT
jgi:putative transposase